MISNLFYYSSREVLRSVSELKWILFSTALGLALILFVLVLGDSSEKFIQTKSRESLMGDVLITSQSPLQTEELKNLENILKPIRASRKISFGSMISFQGRTVLVEISGINDTFPLRGQLVFSNSQLTPSDLRTQHGLAVDSEILTQLGAKIGDRLQIGSESFPVLATVQQAPGGFSARFGLAPELFISLDDVLRLGLTELGSQVSYRYYYNLASPEISAKALEEIRKNEKLNVRTPEDSLANMARVLTLFRTYVGIASLVLILISFLAGYYFFQFFLMKRSSHAALYLQFSGSALQTQLIFFVVIAFILLLSLGLASAFAGLTLFLSHWIWGASWPEGFRLVFEPSLLTRALILWLSLTLGYASPLLLRLRRLTAKQLLEEGEPSLPLISGHELVLAFAIPILAFFIIASLALSSWKMAAAFLLAILLIGILVIALLPFLLRKLLKLPSLRRSILSFPLSQLSRLQFASGMAWLCTTFIAALGILLINLVSTIKGELSFSDPQRLPRYFLINIQRQDLESLKAFIEERKCRLSNISPFILARMTSINGRSDFSDQLKKFPVRLSYRSGLSSSESLDEGPPLPPRFDPKISQLPLISVEREFAERNRIQLGDKLDFDIQGVPITGQAHNFRRVQWTSFQPNFFLQFQTGVLEEAPQSSIANIYSSSENPSCDFQYELVQKFPGLSLIDVRKTAQKVVEWTDALLKPLQWIGLSSLFAGLFQLFFVLLHQIRSRQPQFFLMGLLGASPSQLRKLLVLEFEVLALVATGVGALIGLALSAFAVEHVLGVSLNGDPLMSSLFLAIVVLGYFLISWSHPFRRL